MICEYKQLFYFPKKNFSLQATMSLHRTQLLIPGNIDLIEKHGSSKPVITACVL